MKTQKATREKTVSHKETKYVGKAVLTYTPPTRYGGVVTDAQIDYRGKRVSLEPMTLAIVFDQAKKKTKEIDVEIAIEKLNAWNRTAREIIDDSQKKSTQKKSAQKAKR